MKRFLAAIGLFGLATAALLISGALAKESSDQTLEARAVERRAVEAVIWGMPAVNYDLMLQEMQAKTAAKVNEVVYWGKPLDWHNQTLTPNPDAIYFMAFFNTKDAGPMVLEVPPADGGSMNANIVNIWQMPLEDAGLLGVDKGKGVKLLIVPPGYDETVPEGYEILRPETFGSYALLRSNLASHDEADIAKSVAYGKRIKVYPLSKAAEPPATKFTDASGVLFDSTIHYDLRFFEGLDRIVQTEPWLDRDRAMIDPLKTLGIEKGKPFKPDAATKAQLEAGVEEARALLDATYDKGLPSFFEGTHWTNPAPTALVKEAQAGFTDPNAYSIDERGLAYSYAFIGLKRLGAGQFYLINIKDKNGQAYDGSRAYKLTVPPNAPVEQYWSVTAYDRKTHALIRDVSRASRSSQIADLQKNGDGSIDIYFGPKAPVGKEANWVPTKPGRQFELMFRLYGPTKALFDKAWTLPDLEPIGSRTITLPATDFVPVTVATFIRAESDLYFSAIALKEDGFGKFEHKRELSPVDAQTVIRQNRDTLYSAAVFDLDAGPVTITLPDAGQRFMSMQIINQDEESLPAVYAPGVHILAKEKIGTRYVLVGVRTLVNPFDPADMAKGHALQNAILVKQKSPGSFEVSRWDPVGQKEIRDALIVLGATLNNTSHAFGKKDEVDPVQRLISAATTWGGNPRKDAIYLNFTPPKNDGNTVYRLHVKDVPVDGFWSISVYNADGYFQKNPLDAYSLNNITAKTGTDGSTDIQFGGCDGKVPNCLPIMANWNYTVRLYRPKDAILNGAWQFPEAQERSDGARESR